MPLTTTSSNKTIGLRACEYARSYVAKGSTHLKNNAYEPGYQNALMDAIEDIRDSVGQPKSSQISAHIDLLKQANAFSKKFSIGNCNEMALLALEFMIKEHPKIQAEYCSISGGDHVFIVIGRKKNSDPKSPKTWGKDAYICDPWSNEVYPASHYLTKTKDYYWTQDTTGKIVHDTKDFNPQTQALSLHPILNSKAILNGIKNNVLILKTFKEMHKSYLFVFEQLAERLQEVSQRLFLEYGSDDPKFEVIHSHIENLRGFISNSRVEFDALADRLSRPYIDDMSSTSRFKENFVTLRGMMWKQVSSLQQASTLTSMQKNILNQYNKEDNLLTKILKFLNILPQSLKDSTAAVKESESQIANLNSLFKNN